MNNSLVDNFFLFFFSWSQGANVAFLTQWRMFEFEIGGCSCFLFFCDFIFSRRSLAQWQWQLADQWFSFRFRRCGLSGLPYFRFRGANPCWKLKCGRCSSIDASCCYMAWLRLKSCVPRLPHRFQIESTTVSTWHQYCYIIVVMFFSGLGQHLDFFLVPQFHMTV